MRVILFFLSVILQKNELLPYFAVLFALHNLFINLFSQGRLLYQSC